MTRFRFGNLQYFFRPCASSKPNGYTFSKVNEIIPYFCRRLHLHPNFFVKKEILFFSPSPLRGKVEKSISPRKIKGETHIRPSRKRPNLSFHKMPSSSTAPTASDRSRASARSRGRFLPLFAARRSYAKLPPVPTSIRPSTPPTFLHISAPLLSFRSSSTDEIRRSSPTHPLWVIRARKRRRESSLSLGRSLRMLRMGR